MTELYYDLHVLCCTNERPQGHQRGCCATKNSMKYLNYIKARVKELKIPKSRVNKSGCLDRCELGPAIVIYPEGTWYSCHSIEDAEEIIQKHILGGEVVERLQLLPNQEELREEQVKENV